MADFPESMAYPKPSVAYIISLPYVYRIWRQYYYTRRLHRPIWI